MKERVFPSNVQPIASEIARDSHLEKRNATAGKRLDLQKIHGRPYNYPSYKNEEADVFGKGMLSVGFEKRIGDSCFGASKQKVELLTSTGFNYSKARQFEEANRVFVERNKAAHEKLVRMQTLSEYYDTDLEKALAEEREAQERLRRETAKCDELQKAKETLKIDISEARAKLERVEKSLDKQTITVHKNNSKLAEIGSELINAKAKFEIAKQAFEAAKIKRNIDGPVAATAIKNQLQEESAAQTQLAAELIVINDEFNKKSASMTTLRSDYKEYQRLLTEFNQLRLKYYEELNQRTIGQFAGLDAQMS